MTQQMGQPPVSGGQPFAVNNGGFIPMQNNPYAPPISETDDKRSAHEHNRDIRPVAKENPQENNTVERDNRVVEKTEEKAPDKKICPNCNAELAGTAKFCKVCGAPQQ
jgi:ribosomal protein L40E